MKKILIVVLSVLILAGCTAPGGTGVQPPDPGGDATPAPTAASAVVNLLADIRADDWPVPQDELDPKLRSPMMNFAWTLFQASAANEGNVLISPTSVYLALAMTINGAAGDTLAAMQTALQSQDLSMDDINAACRDWISLLREQTDKTTVSVANSIWFRQDYPISLGFLQTDSDYFDAEVQGLDFSNPQAVDIINGWVQGQTDGKIDEIIEQIDANTVMYLINAVYFKSDWQTPFDANSTKEGEFAAGDGTVMAQFMHRSGDMDYVDGDGATGVMLPYDDGRYAFFAMLPPEGEDVRDYVASMDGDTVAGLLAAMKTGCVALTLPKLEAGYSDSLLDELTDLGMGIAFDPASADFSSMNSAGNKDLCISEVMHKTWCRVDEKGSEAAAVTSVEMSRQSIPSYDARISFDRPFVYGIVDRASGTPLFLGILEDPSR